MQKSEIPEEERKLFKTIIDSSLLLLSPIIPHITHVLWNVLQNGKEIYSEAWPTFDSNLLEEKTYKLIIQVNGKLRGSLELDEEKSEKEIKHDELITDFIGFDKIIEKYL